MNTEKYLSPVDKQEFIWFAQYDDHRIITEFEDSLQENKFDSIDKSSTDFFGLLGKRKRYFYSTKTGEFYILGNRISFFLREADTEQIYNLTNPSKDLITYKLGISDYIQSTGEQINRVGAYYFGYKNCFKEKDREFFVKFIYAMPAHSEERAMLIWLVVDKKFKGSLYAQYNGVENFMQKVETEANVGIEIQWEI